MQNQVKYVPAGTGPMYCGPGDRVSFLATEAVSSSKAWRRPRNGMEWVKPA